MTHAAQDPISKIPEYKVCAVRVRRASTEEREAAEADTRSSMQIGATRAAGETALGSGRLGQGVRPS